MKKADIDNNKNGDTSWIDDIIKEHQKRNLYISYLYYIFYRIK